MKYGKRNSQTFSQKNDWLCPDLTWNTQRRYILKFLAVLITLVILQYISEPISVTNTVSHYPPYACKSTNSVYDRTSSPIVQHMYGESWMGIYGICIIFSAMIYIKRSSYVSVLDNLNSEIPRMASPNKLIPGKIQQSWCCTGDRIYSQVGGSLHIYGLYISIYIYIYISIYMYKQPCWYIRFLSITKGLCWAQNQKLLGLKLRRGIPERE